MTLDSAPATVLPLYYMQAFSIRQRTGPGVARQHDQTNATGGRPAAAARTTKEDLVGFEFSSHTVTVEIGGKPYVINMGDADMLDKVEHWSDKLAGTDYRGLSEGRLNALSADVRNYLMALLGKEQFEQVFENRPFDFIDGLELFAFLYAEIAKSRVDASFKATLGKYLPDLDWHDAEA